MKLPFVSRERFTELQERVRELEAENKRITNMLIERLSKPEPFSSDQKDLSAIQPIPGRPTIGSVIGEANRAAFKNAQNPGAKSIASELAEHAKVWSH
jgi:hypothetical protein